MNARSQALKPNGEAGVSACDNPFLFGHDAAERQVLALAAEERLPHAFLLAGARGLGKASFAYRFARFLLAPAPEGGLFGPPPPATTLALPPEHPVFRRVALGAHPDFMALAKDDIKVEEVRAAVQFLNLTPAEGTWRVLLIDSADGMNRNAANALLKTLEEPSSHTMLLLVSHNPAHLLPTIRSRCRVLRFQPLLEPDFLRAVTPLLPLEQHPALPTLQVMARGAPGVALWLAAEDAPARYQALLALLLHPDAAKLQAFADHAARKGAEAAWQMARWSISFLLSRLALPGSLCAPLHAEEAAALAALGPRKPLDSWAELWNIGVRHFDDAERLHLDRSATMLLVLNHLLTSGAL